MTFGTFTLGKIVKRFDEQGNFSDTYLAKDINLNRQVVVKDLRPESVNGDVFEAFTNEIHNLSAVEHSRICPVLFAGSDAATDNKYRIVTAYFKNGSLQKKLTEVTENNKTLNHSYIVEVLLYVCSALENLHCQQIIHNDIKPSNILLDDAGLPVLTDFGQSKVLTASFDDAPGTYGKNISPEFLNERVAGFQTDIYQVGLLIYRLLHEESFNSQFQNLYESDPTGGRLRDAIINGTFPDRESIPVAMPKQLVDIAKKCLEVDTEDRYEDIFDVQQDLAKVEAQPVHYDFKSQTLAGSLNDCSVEIFIDALNDRYNIKVKRNGSHCTKLGKQELSGNNLTEFKTRVHLKKILSRLARC